MEDEDDFGDLYTDVISTFPHSISTTVTATHPPPPFEIDNLNLRTSEQIDNLNLNFATATTTTTFAIGKLDVIPKEENLGMNNKESSNGNGSDSEDDCQIVFDESNPIPNCVFHDNGDDRGLLAVGNDNREEDEAGNHAFPSQLKDVRPGTADLPTDQVRPPFDANPGHWGPTDRVPPRSLNFILPSYKTIFEVDIDSFKEKPWKYPGADVSDFFNFNLNEESWKAYCKQLELSLLESKVQSKIHVYESLAEQGFDPELPPELAAAVTINDSPSENADIVKAEGGLGNPAKEDARAPPLLLTGRPIQVGIGVEERLPSVYTRLPRLCDSDVIIEIYLEESLDVESADNSDTGNPDNESVEKGESVTNDVNVEDLARKWSPLIGSPHDDVYNKEKERLSPDRASINHHSGSKDQDSSEDIGTPCKKRWTKETTPGKSPHMSSAESEYSTDSMEQHKCTPESSSLAHVAGDAKKSSGKGKEMTDDDIEADKNSRKVKENSTDTSKNKRRVQSREQLASLPVELSSTKYGDHGNNFGISISSKTRRKNVDDEAKHDERSMYMRNVKRHRGEDEHISRRKEVDGRIDIEKNHVPRGCRTRDGVVSRNKRKVSENDRSGKDEYLQSRYFLDNGSLRSYHHEKDAELPRYQENDDVYRSKKRRKNDNGFIRSNTRVNEDKEGSLNHRKRDDHLRFRDTYDDHHSDWLQDETLVRRVRAEQLRDRDDWYLAKQAYEENLYSKRSRRPVEKVWLGHPHRRDEFKSYDKDAGGYGQQGSQTINKDKRHMQKKVALRKNDSAVGVLANHKLHEEKIKDSLIKKTRESGGHNISETSKRHRGEKGVVNDMADVKCLSERAVAEHETSLHPLSKENREDISTDDEQQDSKRGRSKLERWRSSTDRDLGINSNSSSLEIKEITKNKFGVETVKNEVKLSVEDAKPTNSQRFDTMERLKKRKERFHHELTCEKDLLAIKMMESESNAEVKQERPYRKRMWLRSS